MELAIGFFVCGSSIGDQLIIIPFEIATINSIHFFSFSLEIALTVTIDNNRGIIYVI